MATGYLPIPLFLAFTAFTPAVPNLYWDVDSEEQRYFALCEQFHKLVCYANTIAERINNIQQELEDTITEFEGKISEQLAEQDMKIAQQLAEQDARAKAELEAMRKYIDMKFDAIAEGTMAYDVTTGTYRPTMEAMRRLYSALAYDHTGDRAIVEDVAAQKVSDLANETCYKLAWSGRANIVIDDQLPIIEGD